MRTLFSTLTSISFAFIPGTSTLTTISLSFSKMSTDGFHSVVDTAFSQSLSRNLPNLPGNMFSSRKGSHLISDMVLPPFRHSQRHVGYRPQVVEISQHCLRGNGKLS